MSLPHKEWRAYLDNILDVYMRANITIDSGEYMVDRMEQIFSEHLHTVPEQSTNLIYPLSLDPLDDFLKKVDIQTAISSLNSATLGLEERWLVKREIMDYIKGVIKLNSIKATASRPLPSVDCWLQNDIARPLMVYMESAILSRAAKTQTPLQQDGGSMSYSKDNTATHLKKETIDSSAGQATIPDLYHGRRKASSSTNPVSFLEEMLRFEFLAAPIQEEAVSDSAAEMVIAPKISIPRAATEGILSLVKSTPFHSNSRTSVAGVSCLRSLASMQGGDEERRPLKIGRARQLSPPIFSVRHREKDQKATWGIAGSEAIRKTVELAKDSEMEIPESETLMETMRLAEGWPTAPLLLSSPTPPLTSDISKGDACSMETEDENVIQIDELRFPGSPPYGNKELKQLFHARMEKVLLPRADYPFQQRGPTFQTPKESPTARTHSFFATIKETLQLPVQTSLADPPGQGHISKETGDEEVDELLEEMCLGVKGLDNYLPITRERIEEDNGAFLPVPHLAAPNDGLQVIALQNLAQMTSPLTSLPLQEITKTIDVPWDIDLPIVLVKPAGGVASLSLELSWHPFVYRGPLISHETVSNTLGNPFHIPGPKPSPSTSEMIGISSQEHTSFRRLWDDPEERISRQSTTYLFDHINWSNDGVLLLSRMDMRMAQGTQSTHDAKDLKFNPFRCLDDISESIMSVGSSGEDDLKGPYSRDQSPSLVSQGIGLTQDKDAYSLRSAEEDPHPWYHRQNTTPADAEPLGTIKGRSSQGPRSSIGPSWCSVSTILPTAPTDIVMMDNQDNSQGLHPPSHLILLPHPSSASTLYPDQQSIAFSNGELLREFLTHRGEASYRYPSHKTDTYLSPRGPLESVETQTMVNSSELSWEPHQPTFPPGLLSQCIVPPKQWSTPRERHRYLASVPVLQRRALVLCLAQECSVDLSEFDETDGPDLIIDSHTAVKFITVSDIISSNLEALAMPIIELGYGFTRVVLLLEAFPSSESFSARRSEQSRWELEIITEETILACGELKRVVTTGMGLLEGAKEFEELGDVQVEFILSPSVGEMARLLRCLGDYAEREVDYDERAMMWGDREWLDADNLEDATRLGRYRGMNIFAALAISEVKPLDNFVCMPQSDKLHSFGALIGGPRMVLFEQNYSKTNDSVPI